MELRISQNGTELVILSNQKLFLLFFAQVECDFRLSAMWVAICNCILPSSPQNRDYNVSKIGLAPCYNNDDNRYS